jgi:tRNA A37 threonylcarbamoyladenosine synthetase subunit TsaC/SUA5/YrdC
MVKELTEKCYPGSMSWIVPVDQLKVWICYQRHRTHSQIVVRVQNPTLSTELHKSVADRICWRRESRQMEHPTEIS